MRYLGLDFGSKTLGIAVSDETGLIASPVTVLRYETLGEVITYLNNFINESNIDEIVLGNPINMDGTEGKKSIETLKFKKLLEESLDIKVNMQDERLTTIEAEKVLINANTRRNKRKRVIDKIAATIILQEFLNKRRR